MPKSDAQDFKEFCERNPGSLPLGEYLTSSALEKSAKQSDLKTDLPKYRIYENGKMLKEVTDITEIWEKYERDTNEKLCAFLLGCSFTAETDLIENGIELRHIQQGKNVAMYRTNIPLVDTARFNKCTMVVSMRPIKKDKVDLVNEVCRLHPMAHGVPVHIGSPAEIGI